MDDLKIAAVCMKAIPGEIGANLDRIEALARAASANRADFVCFPELSVTGYIQESPEQIYQRNEMQKILDRLVCIARNSKIVLLAGLIEISNEGKPYIAQIIAGPKGLIGAYRKTHLGPTETTVYRPGQKIDVFRTRNTTFGVQLCYEGHFPEISTKMALMGADILFMPHASPRGEPKQKLRSWLRHLPARAFDNGVFVVACNQVGETEGGLSFPGVAVIFGPDGQLLAKYAGEEETLLYGEVKANLLQDVRRHRMKYFLPKRRPEIYARTPR